MSRIRQFGCVGGTESSLGMLGTYIQRYISPVVAQIYTCIYIHVYINSLLINMKMPTVVGILILISRENFMLS